MASINKETLEEVRGIFTAYLERKNQRKTPERYNILEEIYKREDHFDAEELFQTMQKNNYNVSRATVYNTLELLVNCELITKHQWGKNHAQYERSFGFRQHDHLICSTCGEVLEFCDPRIQHIKDSIGNLFEKEISRHSLTLYGLCVKPNCEKKP